MKRRKIILLLAAIPIAIAAVVWLCAGALIDRKWSEMEQRVRELEAEARSRDPRRAVPRGEPVSGNSWQEFNATLKQFLVETSPGDHRLLAEFWNRSPKSNPAQTAALLDGLGPSFEALRRGARRAEGQFPHSWGALDWEGISDSPVGVRAQTFALAAGCEARRLAESGRIAEAIDLLLSIAQFGHDVGSNGTLISEMVGVVVTWYALDELRSLIQSGKLDREQLLGIDRALEILDKDFIRNGPCLRNEVLMMGQQILKGNLKEIARGRMSAPDPERIRPTWRQMFSRKLLQATAFLLIERWSARLANDDAPYADELRAWDEFRAEAAANPLAAVLLQGLTPHVAQRGRLAELRLVRAIAHYRATGEVLPLDDPFGTKLHHAITGGKLKVWSVGKNGVDDGGIGEWSSSRGKDIVLEVDR